MLAASDTGISRSRHVTPIRKFLREIQAIKDQTLRVPFRGSLDITGRCREAAREVGYPPDLFVSEPTRVNLENLVHTHFRIVTPALDHVGNTEALADAECVLREFVGLIERFKLGILCVDIYSSLALGSWNVRFSLRITFYQPTPPQFVDA